MLFGISNTQKQSGVFIFEVNLIIFSYFLFWIMISHGTYFIVGNVICIFILFLEFHAHQFLKMNLILWSFSTKSFSSYIAGNLFKFILTQGSSFGTNWNLIYCYYFWRNDRRRQRKWDLSFVGKGFLLKIEIYCFCFLCKIFEDGREGLCFCRQNDSVERK